MFESEFAARYLFVWAACSAASEAAAAAAVAEKKKILLSQFLLCSICRRSTHLSAQLFLQATKKSKGKERREDIDDGSSSVAAGTD